MKEQESDQARALLQKYLYGQCTAAEEQQVLRWFYALGESDRESTQPQQKELAARINERLNQQLFSEPAAAVKRLRWYRSKWMVAALLLLFFGLGYWTYTHLQTVASPQPELAAQVPSANKDFHNDILPGGQYAKLISPAGNSRPLTDPYVQKEAATAGQRFVVDVPKAGSYMIVLEDGTKVWLNASTQLSYPAHFEADQRLVSLSGEAYFEVAKDAKRPFRIEANGTTIEVLGTTFNVSAYQNEVSTSLVEGSVRVRKADKVSIIKPGQQATTLQGNDIQVRDADLAKNTAWQRDEFYFDGSNFEEVVQQVSRWYNVDFEHAESINSDSTYKGTISRKSRLSEVLQILSVATGRKFDIVGRKVHIQ